MTRSFLGGCLILLAAGSGCYTGGDVTSTAATGSPVATPATTVQPALPSPSEVTGLPCDVATMLARDCATCHAAVPAGGAPDSLMSYANLVAPSFTDPSKQTVDMSLQRMQDPKNPMPPDGAIAGDLDILRSWVANGKPAGTEVCADATAPDNIYDTPPVCSSKTKWLSGDDGSFAMRPGGACNKCHDSSTRHAPSYSAAGTVYKTAHEPDDCNGRTGGGTMKVVITDAAGKTYTAAVNTVGNFAFEDPIKMPYKAKVVQGSKTRTMSAPQSDGDCNKCHTENGTKIAGSDMLAPGRVMAP